jgi:hypothetical protein
MSKTNHSDRMISKLLVAACICGLLSAAGTAETPLTWPEPDEETPSYTLDPREGSMNVFRTPDNDDKLGEVQEVEVYEEEHHVYRAPFRYKNVKVDRWLEYNDKGIEILANGAITITEEKPIVSVTIVGSGCSTPNYNTVEWWAESEDISNNHGQLVKRGRIDNLKGQHAAWLQKAFTRDRFDEKEIETMEEANEFMAKMRRVIYGMTNGYYVPGSIMGGLYENTAYFRIGDVNVFSEDDKKGPGEVFREVVDQYDVHKVVIRGGGMDYEDPGSDRERYPADYAFRLIDVVVKN